MSTSRRVWWVLAAALTGFACAPTLSAAPTLDPFSLNTAIAQTAGAASAQTAAVAQGPSQPAPLVTEGPTLDPAAFQTAIAQTVEAAAAQTQALIPNTLTPSVTPFPTWTPSITPSPTRTFVITIPPTSTRPGAVPTKRNGGGGGGGDDGGGSTSPYSCKALRVSPANDSILPPDTQFEVVWLVKNKGSNWAKRTARLGYVEGLLIPLVRDRDLPPLSQFDVSGGDVLYTPPVMMKTPSKPGIYSTLWRVYVESSPACNLGLTIVVQQP